MRMKGNKPLYRAAAILLAALLLSAGVELAQWRWQLGQAETDDCLANVLGGLLGSGIFALRCRASARLLRRADQRHGRAVQPFARGFSVHTQPGAHQHLIYRITQMCQTKAADLMQLPLLHGQLKIIFHI